jgi:lipopolysaccharide/colanic/teichoic acid biosynthesis glycosyltransferase
MLLAFLAPVLLLIALLVKVDSTGPVLFRQTRIGYLNQPFTCLKFRSMFDHVADLLADRQTTRDDPRVTRVGKWLRRTSLDELPQLVNVLLGDMSLVGPRPHAPNTRAGGRFFAEVVSDYALRHRVKPGMTGWAQVNGWRGETATVLQIEERVRHDLYYIRHWSLVFDIRILLMTATRGFLGKQTY